MKLFKDVNHRFLYYLISFIAIGILYLWFTSSIGLQLAVNGLGYVVKNLKVEGITGSIAGPICIQRLTYQDDTNQLTIEGLCLHWKKAALLRGKFHIKQLALKEIRLINQEKSNQSSFSLGFSWLQIDQIILKACEIQTPQWHLRANGTFDYDGRLYWEWLGYGSAWIGKLEIKSGKDYYLRWIPSTMVARQQNAPTTQTISNHTLAALIESHHNSLSNYVRIWAGVDSKSLLTPSTVWQLDGRIEDERLLQQLRIYGVEDKQSDNGPLRIQGQFHSSFNHLLSYLSRGKTYRIWPYSPIHFELAADWKAPRRFLWGAFRRFAIQGKLYPSRMLWNGHLDAEDKQVNESLNQWKLVGESQVKYGRSGERSAPLNVRNVVTNLKIKGECITFFKDTDYTLGIVPDVNAVISAGCIQLLGKIHIPHAYFKLHSLKANVALDPDIYFIRDNNAPAKEAKWRWDMQLDLELGRAVYLSAGLNARLAGSLAIEKHSHAPATAKGELKLVEGDYYFGQRLQLDPASRLIFTKQLDNPNLDIVASHPLGYELHQQLNYPHSPVCSSVGIYLKGSLQDPSLHLLLTPERRLADAGDELSYLMTGQSVSSCRGKATSLLLSTAGQLSKVYLHRSALSNLCGRFGIATTIQADEPSWNTHFIFSKYLNSQLILSGKVGLIESDYSIGCYSLGKHWIVGANCGIDRRAVGFEMAYQREWG